MSANQTLNGELFKRPRTPPDNRKSRTPAKETFSAEKLKRKMNNETSRLRKQRRDNLFNKQRINLETLALSSSDLAEQEDATSSLEMMTAASVDAARPGDHQQIATRLPPRPMNMKIARRKKEESAAIDTPSSLTPPDSSGEYEYTVEQFTQYYEDLKSKYSTFKQAKPSSASELVQYLNHWRSQATLPYLREKGRDDSIDSISSKLPIEIIALLQEVLNDLVDFCFHNPESQLIEQLSITMTNSNMIMISTLDERRRYLVKLIEFCASSRTLELSQLKTYCNLFDCIDMFIGELRGKTDDLWRYINSSFFIKMLRQHTKFACQLIRSNRTMDCMPNSDCANGDRTGDQITDNGIPSQTDPQAINRRKEQSVYLTKKHFKNTEIEDYMSSLFGVSLAQSKELSLEDDSGPPDDLCQLIANLRELAAYEINEDHFAHFVQILNNYFDPTLDDGVLELLFSEQFVQQCCAVVKTSVEHVNDYRKSPQGPPAVAYDWIRRISLVVGLFSNITALQQYCAILIDLKFADQLASVVAISSEFSELNLLFYVLAMVRNLTSVEGCSEQPGGFQRLGDLNIYDLIFTPTFVEELLRAMGPMNGDCMQQLSVILSNVFKYSKPTVIRQFVHPLFFETLNGLLRMGDPDLELLALQLLCSFKQEESNAERLGQILSYFSSAGLIDSVEALNYSANNQISKLASKLTDDLSELKENISP